jgi:hypothetical protein
MERRKKIVSSWLLFYPDRKREYILTRSDILQSSSASAQDGQPKGTGIGDTTGRKGTAIADLQGADWLKLVEDVQRDISPEMQIYLKLRQESRNSSRGWFVWVQQKYCYAVAKLKDGEPEDYWVDCRAIFFGWWDKITTYAIVLATERKLF